MEVRDTIKLNLPSNNNIALQNNIEKPTVALFPLQSVKLSSYYKIKGIASQNTTNISLEYRISENDTWNEIDSNISISF